MNDQEWQRLTQVRQVLTNVYEGDLSARVPPAGFDYDPRLHDVETSVNDMLERTEELVESLRGGSRVLVHEMKYPFIAARSWMTRAREKMPPSPLRDELDRLIVQIDEARVRADLMAEISLQIADRNDTTGFTKTDLRYVCEDVIVELAAFAKGRGQYLQAELSSVNVFGREHLLAVAVRNLVHNACNHSPLQSPVIIRCKPRNGRAMIEVEDNGPGFPVEIRGEVTNSRSIALATRDSRAGVSGGRGLGLGLRLSAAVFRRHRATMTPIDRNPGPGTIFRVEFPLA